MENTSKVFSIEDIKKLLPHRHPFLLIDRVENVVRGESCTAYKNVSYDAWFFQGHFPNAPIMPGVLIIEAMAQAAGVLALSSINNISNTDSVLFASINNAKFKRQVIPGDTLRIEVKVTQKRLKIWKFEAYAFVKDELSDEAEFVAVIP
ncbi:MAG: 3-hydroxyacyl-ACP dehydratase FabZ [Alphaproteobacteria bacterium]|nr:3-hydroxyacyl-ACP dehydratase FabZ [Alphaproteobacteria bacterium]